ncbi:MAG TPA: potassium channel family protein [Allocoleopsis sp.]
MQRFTHALGIGLLILALVDIFLTVLYPRSGKGWLSVPLSVGLWKLFRTLANLPLGQQRRDRGRFLSFCGPFLLVLVVSVWILLLLLGFAFLIWSALGTEIQASQPPTPTTFTAALYYSGYSLTTLGFGDLVPKTDAYRLLTVFEATVGFAVFTLTITYLVAVYGALQQRNIFALSLHHRTSGTADAAELVARMGVGGQFHNSLAEITQISQDALSLLESHHAHPVLPYFRFKEEYYALARVVLIVMDTATIIRTALDEKRYRFLIRSTAVAELGDGGQHLLVELVNSFLPYACIADKGQPEIILRSWYYQIIDRLQREGIETITDIETGAALYVALRQSWEPYVMAIADYMSYDWSEIAPAEFSRVSYPAQSIHNA